MRFCSSVGIRVGLLGIAALALPWTASAQSLSVSPTSLSVQAVQGTQPASQTIYIVYCSNGALKWSISTPNVSWIQLSQTSGVQRQRITVSFSSNLAAGSYSGSFAVSTSQSTIPVAVQLTVTASTTTAPAPAPAPAGAPLVVSCPANVTATSSNGSAVAVSYPLPTASGGVAPYIVSNNPGSGALFSVGTTTVQGYASSSDGQTANCSFSVTVTYNNSAPAPPPSSPAPHGRPW